MKICSCCKQELDESQFNKDKSRKDGLQYICKICTKEKGQYYYKNHKKQKQDYRKKNKENLQKYQKKYKKKYRLNYKEEIKKQSQEYYQKNKSKLLEQSKKYLNDNRKKRNEYNRKYGKRKKRKEYMKKYNKNGKRKEYLRKYKISHKKERATYIRYKRENDINFKIRDNYRKRTYMALKSNSKKGYTLELLGCSIDQLKQYLESQFVENMNWDNYGFGNDKWNIDHIIPCASFDLTLKENQYKCFHFTNLQPLWQIDNFEKKAKLDWEKLA
jgi:hypothetical protein